MSVDTAVEPVEGPVEGPMERELEVTPVAGDVITLRGLPISQIQRLNGVRVVVHNTAGQRATFKLIGAITPDNIREALRRLEAERERRKARRKTKRSK